MRPVILFLLVILFTNPMQGQLYIGAGAQVHMRGNTQLTLQDMNLLNNGIFFPGSGAVSFTGNNSSGIGGTQTTVFHLLEINKPNGGTVLMQVPAEVLNTVSFTAGNLNLNGNTLNLGTTGSLLGEKESSRMVGSNGGHVLFSSILNNPNATNPANLGLVISTAQNLGTVLIRRGHQSQVNNYGTGNSILRYYDIVPVSPAPFSATFRINYFDGELNGINENGLVFWNSLDTVHWRNEDFTSGNININYIEKTGISSFGRWTLSSSNNALPVKFTLFNLKCEGGKAIVTWKTAQEQNSSHYNIEKSTDGINWIVIGSVPAAGYSNTEKSYLLVDNNPIEKSYYRIAQYDMDRRVSYSNILKSSCTMKEFFTVWPNPFTDRLVINLGADRQSLATIKIFDSKGALVKTQEAAILNGINQLTVNTQALPAGAYILSAVWHNGQEKRTVQVIKQ